MEAHDLLKVSDKSLYYWGRLTAELESFTVIFLSSIDKGVEMQVL